MSATRPTTPLFERLFRRIDRSPGPGQCWPWTGGCSTRGGKKKRGNIEVFSRTPERQALLVHRLALAFFSAGTDDTRGALAEYFRTFEDGTHRHAAHSCHFRLCCNYEDHLYWATPEEHAEDTRQHRRALQLAEIITALAECPALVRAGPSAAPPPK